MDLEAISLLGVNLIICAVLFIVVTIYFHLLISMEFYALVHATYKPFDDGYRRL